VAPLLGAALVAGIVGVAVAVRSVGSVDDVQLPVAGVGGASPAPTEPDPDEDIHSLPSPTGTPADKATIQPGKEGPPFDVKDFPTGIFNDGGAPAPSIRFTANNYWSGFLGDQPLSVYAGYAGYEHPDDGAVFVVYVTKTGGLGSGFMRQIEGSGPLTVTDGRDDGQVFLTNDQGDRFSYALNAETLRADG
jgi:hypothetical protein